MDTKRNIWGGCKLLRSGTNEQEWNGVWIVLFKELKEDMIRVSRNSDDYRARIRRDGG